MAACEKKIESGIVRQTNNMLGFFLLCIFLITLQGRNWMTVMMTAVDLFVASFKANI